MRLILKLLREGSGRILIFLDWMIKPAIVKRSSENQFYGVLHESESDDSL